jgi:hypothetical protein
MPFPRKAIGPGRHPPDDPDGRDHPIPHGEHIPEKKKPDASRDAPSSLLGGLWR